MKEEYLIYLANLLEFKKIEFVKRDDVSYYFKGDNGNKLLKIKINSGRVYINDNYLKIPLIRDPFDFIC